MTDTMMIRVEPDTESRGMFRVVTGLMCEHIEDEPGEWIILFSNELHRTATRYAKDIERIARRAGAKTFMNVSNLM